MILDFITRHTDKERDEETDYDYFGARYYWSLLKHWTKVDPLVDNYLHISPYAYCNWNPIKYVDPDGRVIVVGTWYGRVLAKLGFNNFEAKVTAQLKELKNMDPALDINEDWIKGIRDPITGGHVYNPEADYNNPLGNIHKPWKFEPQKLGL